MLTMSQQVDKSINWSHLIIEIPTKHGSLNVGIRSSTLIVPCHQTKYDGENKNKAKQSYYREVAINKCRKASIVESEYPFQTRNAS